MRFDEFDLNYDVLDALDAMRFSECTPIQEQSIPLTLEGRDLIAVAQTGTGKTAAYLLPVLNRLADGEFPADAVNCIVMAPTRELAMQIDRQLDGFGYFLNISSAAIYGGTDGVTFAQQQRSLLEGADIVIATPGRLLAHLQMGKVDLSRVSFFILDEADRMLDMGFYNDIMTIAKQLPKERQTMLFSATMPQEIRKLAANILTDPLQITLSLAKPAEGISQEAYICHEGQKMGIIKSIFENESTERVILFASRKSKVKDISIALKKRGFNVGEMHSDLGQAERDEIMFRYKSRKIDIIVATDILARGIDIDDIRIVINYDVPRDCDDYIHRVGRTARANTKGRAITFVSVEDQQYFKRIEEFMEQEVPKTALPEELGEAPEYAPNSGRSRGGKRGGNRKEQGGRGHGRRDKSRRESGKPKAKKEATTTTQPAESNAATTGNNEGKKRPQRRRYHRRPRRDKGASNSTVE